ncbi:MAG TPA: DUF481 domain-containing protein [Thermoanaerobaculia bacterium]|jgi:hypothetical protein|nr:DUF481 domain-containing protein [Thermoanaerobaculia bacterium]
MRLRTALPAACLLLVLFAPPALAQKTDVIVLANGDRVTCEIKSYSLGRLTVSTDIASDISVKWNKIQAITSDKRFEIETTDGVMHYGKLAPSTPPGKLDVVSATGTESLAFMAVVRINPIYQSFWRRWDGSLDLGFNYTQANQFVQFTLNADATFRRPTFLASVTLSSFFTSQQGVPSSQRANLSILYEKFLSDRWFVTGFGGLDRNLDLGLDLRGSIGAGVGRDLVQTNRTTVTTIVGIMGDREQPVDGATTSNVTAVVAGKYSTFTYDFPKLTFNASLAIYPYLNDLGRVRLEANAYVKREIVKDFYLSLSLFDSFDSRDPSTQQAKNDWGPVLAIGWTF